MNSEPSTSKKNRLLRLRKSLEGLDALLLLNASHIRYLTGFTGSAGALLIGPNWMTLLVDGRYITQAQGEAPEVTTFEFRNRIDGIAAVLGEHQVGIMGCDAAVLTVAEYWQLEKKLSGVKLEPLDQGLQDLRAVKDDQEVLLIREAAKIAGQALAAVRELVRPGIREREIALELDYRIRQMGGEKVAFETIVAAGPNAALPHATPGDRQVVAGDAVVFDYGAVFAGYHSDETCTCFVGHHDARQREVYDRVRMAHDRAIAAIRPGVACGEIDRVVRATLAEAGLESHFSHGTGHGVGLDIHEVPRLATGRVEILQAGMVVTVEPGVYLPGLWGMRIEDTVLVTESGCEILTPTAKDLTIL